MPRTVPMIASFIDVLGGRLSAGRLFVALFAYDFGDGFVEVDPLSLALDAGYSRHRAERSVAERLRLLEKLGFVRAAAIGHREHGALLLLDPHPVVLGIRRKFPELVDDAWWSAFVDRCRVVGIPLPDEAPNDPG